MEGHLAAPELLLQHLAEVDEESTKIEVWRIEPPAPAEGKKLPVPGRSTRKAARQQREEEDEEGCVGLELREAVDAIRVWNASVAMPADIMRVPTEEGALMMAGAQARARGAQRDRDQCYFLESFSELYRYK